MIGTDEVSSGIDVTATQAFEVKTQKDSSGEESDGSEMELDYEDDKRASVLPDEEDEEADRTAEGGMTSFVASNGDGTQAILVSNPDEANDEEPANTQEGVDDDNDDKRPAGPQDCSVLHDPAVLAAGRITKAL